VRNVLNKYSVRTPVKRRKTAVYSHNRTIATQDFVSTAFLRYGAYPYSTVFCTAVAVYGTVVSPSCHGSASCNFEDNKPPTAEFKLASFSLESKADVAMDMDSVIDLFEDD
jgi:hypothetical protein